MVFRFSHYDKNSGVCLNVRDVLTQAAALTRDPRAYGRRLLCISPAAAVNVSGGTELLYHINSETTHQKDVTSTHFL